MLRKEQSCLDTTCTHCVPITYLFGVHQSEDDILSGLILEDGCDCTSETTEGNLMLTYYEYLDYYNIKKANFYSACSIEENTKYSGHNLYTRKGIKVGNMAGGVSLCFEDSKCKFWTYNPR